MTVLPSRRQNRLPKWDYAGAGYYFVTVCTKDKAHTLGNIVGGDVLIAPHMRVSDLGRLVEEKVQQMPSVDKYVVMPNHVHLILRLGHDGDGPMGTSAPTQSIPKLVHFLKAEVTKAWGSPVWQRSYYDHIIRSEADYLRIWEYIHTNPAKWAGDEYYAEGRGYGE